MASISPIWIHVKNSLSDNLINIAANDATNNLIIFEPIAYSDQVANMLILATKALSISNSPVAPGPFTIEYEEQNGLNLFTGISAPFV